MCFTKRPLPISNRYCLNSLENRRLKDAISPYKIETDFKGKNTKLLARDLAAINEFLHFVDAEPFVTTEKAENHKRVAFKKVKTK